MTNFTPQHKQYLKNIKRKNILVITLQIGLLLAFVAIWEILAQLGAIDSFFTSSPSRVLSQIISLASSGQLWIHVWASTYETLLGFVLGTAIGYTVACLLWWNETLCRVLEPYLIVLNSLPKIALGPLIILWVGTGKMAIIVMALLISVIITTITLLNGFLETDTDKIMLLRSMHANKWQILTKLVLPSNIPTLMATLKINVGMSWVGTIMGEYLVSKEGLGYLIVYGSQTFKLDLVVACTLMLCALAASMYGVVSLLEKQVTKYNN